MLTCEMETYVVVCRPTFHHFKIRKSEKCVHLSILPIEQTNANFVLFRIVVPLPYHESPTIVCKLMKVLAQSASLVGALRPKCEPESEKSRVDTCSLC